jgi:hypothetical protein
VAVVGIGGAAIYDRRQRRRGNSVRDSKEIQRRLPQVRPDSAKCCAASMHRCFFGRTSVTARKGETPATPNEFTSVPVLMCEQPAAEASVQAL